MLPIFSPYETFEFQFYQCLVPMEKKVEIELNYQNLQILQVLIIYWYLNSI